MTADIIKIVIWVAVTAVAIYLMVKEKSKVPDGQVSDEVLSKKDKVKTWILCFLDPVVAGAIFYYGWRKKFPVKAKQANQISLWAFFILLIFSIAFVFFFNFSAKKVPQAFINKYNEVYELKLKMDVDISAMDMSEIKTTQNIDRQTQLLSETSSTLSDAILKIDTLSVKTNELKILANDISDKALMGDALKLTDLIEKMNTTSKKLLGLQKKIIDELLVYSKNIIDGQKINPPADIADLKSQVTATSAELKVAVDQYTVARDEFAKKAGLTFEND